MLWYVHERHEFWFRSRNKKQSPHTHHPRGRSWCSNNSEHPGSNPETVSFARRWEYCLFLLLCAPDEEEAARSSSDNIPFGTVMYVTAAFTTRV